MFRRWSSRPDDPTRRLVGWIVFKVGFSRKWMCSAWCSAYRMILESTFKNSAGRHSRLNIVIEHKYFSLRSSIQLFIIHYIWKVSVPCINHHRNSPGIELIKISSDFSERYRVHAKNKVSMTWKKYYRRSPQFIRGQIGKSFAKLLFERISMIQQE